MPKQDFEVLEVLLRQIADDREVNGVLGERFWAYSLRPIDASHSAMPLMAFRPTHFPSAGDEVALGGARLKSLSENIRRDYKVFGA